MPEFFNEPASQSLGDLLPPLNQFTFGDAINFPVGAVNLPSPVIFPSGCNSPTIPFITLSSTATGAGFAAGVVDLDARVLPEETVKEAEAAVAVAALIAKEVASVKATEEAEVASIAKEVEDASVKAAEEAEAAKIVTASTVKEVEDALFKPAEEAEAANTTVASIAKGVKDTLVEAAENAASQSTAINESAPIWIRDAAAYLEDDTLGRDWRASIQLWTKLEWATGYYDKVRLD